MHRPTRAGRSITPAGSLPLAADCFNTRLHLHEFVDDELDRVSSSSALRTLMLAHLSACPRCARIERHLRALRERLRRVTGGDLAPEPMSDAFRARMARLLAG